MATVTTWLLTFGVYVVYAPSYFHALRGTVGAYHAPAAPLILLPHAILAILALAAIAVAVSTQRTFLAPLWSFVSLAEFECSWYLAWAFPYAAMRPKLFAIYLLSLPLAAYELASTPKRRLHRVSRRAVRGTARRDRKAASLVAAHNAIVERVAFAVAFAHEGLCDLSDRGSAF